VSPADLEMVVLLILGPLNVVLPLGLVALDFRFLLTPEQRARSWPDATLGAAALMFGPLFLPLHFAMTRWVGQNWKWRWGFGLLGLAAGTVLLLLLAFFNSGVTMAIEWLVLGRVEGL
jgi:hypothetical protein